MVEFNSFERKIALLLNSFPKFKKSIKRIYQIYTYVLFGMNKKKYYHKYPIISVNELLPIEFCNFETFFGYYDKSPLNITNEFLIFHITKDSTSSLPNSKSFVEIVLFDMRLKKILQLLPSFSFNWQQGTKLQWISDYEFIYNSWENNSYFSIIYNAKTLKEVKRISFPIYDVKNNFALSLSFRRLSILRPDYGYRNMIDEEDFDIKNINDDGIFIVDIVNNTVKLLYSLKYLSEFENSYVKGNTIDIKHKVNHIMISPDGERFIFLHRYFIHGRKYDRLLISNIDGSNLKVISDHEMISHCCWLGNTKIISYMRRYDTGDNYYVIDLDTQNISVLNGFKGKLYGDGHPFVKNSNLLVFDTYPDKTRLKNLFLHDLSKSKTVKIGSFYESFKFYGETRCDLHPKFSEDCMKLFFESVHDGKRKLYIMDIPTEI